MTGLQTVPMSRLRTMIDAGRQVRDCWRDLRYRGSSPVAEMLRGHGTFSDWGHYPQGDVYDPDSHSQYYYHAHSPEERERRFGAEHGHFHTFLRPKGMPPGIAPAAVADYAPPEGDNDALAHLIAIAMDPQGRPIRLFTTNRWVTGETWYSAESVVAMVDRFRIGIDTPSPAVNIWITAMLRLFGPDIEELLAERDRAVADWQDRHPDGNVYEDRGLEIASIREISVDSQIRAAEDALTAAKE